MNLSVINSKLSYVIFVIIYIWQKCDLYKPKSNWDEHQNWIKTINFIIILIFDMTPRSQY